MFELTQDNLRLFAAKHYINSCCLGEEEFLDDFNLPHKIEFHLNKQQPDIRRLINLVIVYYNVFERMAATRILFYLMKPKNHGKLKTILVTLNRFPKELDYEYQVELDPFLLQRIIQEIGY